MLADPLRCLPQGGCARELVWLCPVGARELCRKLASAVGLDTGTFIGPMRATGSPPLAYPSLPGVFNPVPLPCHFQPKSPQKHPRPLGNPCRRRPPLAPHSSGLRHRRHHHCPGPAGPCPPRTLHGGHMWSSGRCCPSGLHKGYSLRQPSLVGRGCLSCQAPQVSSWRQERLGLQEG